MNARRKPVILVGVSGSAASRTALRWAAAEAKRIGADLVAVRAWEQPRRAAYAQRTGAAADLRERARLDLAAAVSAVLGRDVARLVTSEVTEGAAERVLVARSADADLLVLGEASGLTAGRSIGPVVRSCLSRAACPVVLVSPENYAREPASAIADFAAAIPAERGWHPSRPYMLPG
jgi:nucleotide-binding universal stress UspA family protein